MEACGLTKSCVGCILCRKLLSNYTRSPDLRPHLLYLSPGTQASGQNREISMTVSRRRVVEVVVVTDILETSLLTGDGSKPGEEEECEDSGGS